MIDCYSIRSGSNPEGGAISLGKLGGRVTFAGAEGRFENGTLAQASGVRSVRSPLSFDALSQCSSHTPALRRSRSQFSAVETDCGR